MSEHKYHYLTEPFDVLFFRNNKAFDFGEWHSEGIFPPLPSTFQGFVRTSILLKNKWLENGKVKWNEAQKVIGDDSEFPFDLFGPYLFSPPNDWYFPAPRDLLMDGDTARQTRISSTEIETDAGKLLYSVDHPKAYYLCYGNEFISFNELNDYRRFGEFCYKKREVAKTEEHYGISLGDKKQVVEHHFYLTPYQRLDNSVSFYFSITHKKKLESLDGQTGRLGSEGRGAVIRNCDNQLNLKFEDSFYAELVQDGKFKLILLQPGIFARDWLPFTGSKNSYNEIVLGCNGVKLKLLFAQTDQSLKISGMNYKQEKSVGNGKVRYDLKPMVNAVPAGSIYYFEIIKNGKTDAEVIKILRDLDGSKIPNGNYSKMGYNQIVLGKIF